MNYFTNVTSNVFLCYFYTDPVTLYFSNYVFLFFGCAVNMASEVVEVGKKEGKMFWSISMCESH